MSGGDGRVRSGGPGAAWREASGFLIVFSAFLLVAVLVMNGVDPAATIGVVTATGLGAAEVVRRVRKSAGNRRGAGKGGE